MTLVPIREEDKVKPYYKYYEQGIPSPSEEQLKMVAASGHEKGLISVHERHKLIEGGSFPAEIGFYPLIRRITMMYRSMKRAAKDHLIRPFRWKRKHGAPRIR